MQTEINFTKTIIHRENNLVSQENFEANEPRFRGQCKIVMDAFLRGEKLTVVGAMINYKIGDLRRRIKGLKDIYEVEGIVDEMIGKGFKMWCLDLKKFKINNG